MIGQIVRSLEKYSQKCNPLQPPEAASFWHGGLNDLLSHIF